jgi:catalase
MLARKRGEQRRQKIRGDGGDNANANRAADRSLSLENVAARGFELAKDGAMRFDGNEGKAPNYEPNSFGGPKEDPAYRERPKAISGSVDRHNHRLDNDYYTQPGNLFRLMTPDARERLVGNIVGRLSAAPRRIQELQVQHFYKADPAYGTGVAKGLSLKIQEVIGRAKEVTAAD